MTPQLKQEYCLEQHSQIVADLAQQCADDAITQEELKSAGNEELLSAFSKLKSENKLLIGDRGAILVSCSPSYRGYSYFATYAWTNIRRAMESAVFERKYHIRIPIRYVDFINKFTRVNLNHPTPKEMAEAVQCSEQQHAQNILILMQAPVSIESVVDSDGSTLQDTIPDPNAEDPMDTLLGKDRKRFLKDFFSRELGPREAKVLQLRYGIDVNQGCTLEELGRQFDGTRERIREIEAKALRKMRHPRREKMLRKRMENE